MQEMDGKGAGDMGAIMARHATLLAAWALILAGAAMAREVPSEPHVWHNATLGRAGELWFNLDDQHQWGLRFRAISGDPRRYGRAYIATDGRGLLYGDPVAATGE